MKAITDVQKPVKRPERILQFGEGNFLRAFSDWMIDITNEKTDFNGNVVLIQPIERGLAEMINNQHGLYTTVLRGVQDGKTVEELRLINSVSRCINPYSEYDEYLKCAENPDLRFILSNTTEAGIAWSATDKPDDQPQQSFPGKVTSFLAHRFRHFSGDTSKGLVFIPCELIDKNGDKLKEYVLRHAAAWNLDDDFIDWVNTACDFCNSLVDRIVPGYPKEEAAGLTNKTGYIDNLLDAAEIFHLWVIETRKDYSKEFPLVAAGLNVIWTKDMSFYRTRKVRILNGAHTLTVPAAFLYGLDTVEECIKDELVYRFMKKGIYDEIIPSMDGDETELKTYASDVLERFANPYIKHLLLSITLNSVSKFKTRDLPSLIAFIGKTGKVPPALAFSLAALIAFYQGTEIVNGELEGVRNGKPYAIKDDLAVLQRFAALYREGGEADERARKITKAVLSDSSWWGEDLTSYAGLEDQVSLGLEMIWSEGMKAALEKVCD
ncbi:tagaturonate reductase [Desulfopila aestuarii]|uniref:Tagaturonate reductase n=1 Tax=Desulfopila aestuarii DSM 18488 TaxID=1121416 RepID=A0A1M7YES5_9BACT|nr:tagaturonate reductase [Desulfopila aestuarii]SHO51144.1 tagaturonate reductase [Desulfopila aestuarii DSM 18488]